MGKTKQKKPMGRPRSAWKSPDPELVATCLFEHHGVVLAAFKAYNSKLPADSSPVPWIVWRKIVADPLIVQRYDDLVTQHSGAGFKLMQKMTHSYAEKISQLALQGETEQIQLQAAMAGLRFASFQDMRELARKISTLEEQFAQQMAAAPLIDDTSADSEE